MLVTRTSLLISATTAVLFMAAQTGAEAGFLCQRGMGGYAKFYHSAPKVRISKTPYAQPTIKPRSVTAARPTTTPAKVAKAPVKAPVENPTKSASTAAAKPVSVASAKPIEAPATADFTPVAAPTETCLVKEYLETGVVRFRDICTKEWAINSIDRDAKSSKIRSACLTKQNSQNGVVMFKDTCTGEWAMNTAKQIALAKAE